MLRFYGGNDCYVVVEKADTFYLDTQDEPIGRVTRAELEAFRNAIDRALNTSQDEIDADGEGL